MIEHLTQLIYSEDVSGSLKVYRFQADGYHSGGQYFTKRIRYPDEEIGIEAAKALCEAHQARGLEVRITNGSDFLVFHAQGQKVLYPQSAEAFWSKVLA